MNSIPSTLLRALMVLPLLTFCSRAQSWIASTAPTQAWTSVACSLSGANLIAASHDGSIYTSANAALKWSRATGAPSQPWVSVASSGDGLNLIAASDVGNIAVSTNSGASWTQTDAPTNTWWAAVGLASDGTRAVAAAVDGGLYSSANAGLNWNLTSAPINQWSSVSASADGTRWIAGCDPGPLYLSTDSGVSWSTSNVPVLSWTAVASSADGSRLVAAALLSGIYISTDYGNTWILTSAPTNEAWFSVASSADGSDLIAAGTIGGIYTSTNSGLTWTLNQAPPNLQYSVCLSGDGSQSAAAAYNGGIWIPGTPQQTQSNVVVVIPAGSYQGLFYETNGISPASSGSFNAKLNPKGAFSAKLSLAGKSYGFAGRLPTAKSRTNAAPVGLVTTNKISRPGLSPLTVNLDFGEESNAVVGTISDGQWIARLEADRAFYSLTNAPVLNGTDFTLLLKSDATNPTIAGYGFGAVHVSPTGRITFRGSMGDGQKFSQSTCLNQQNQWPWFASLYAGKGLALGWLTAGSATNAIDGTVAWIRPALFRDALYPTGFTNQLPIQSSVFQLTYSAPVVNFATGVVCFVEGNLLGNFTNQIAVRTNSIIRNLSDNVLSLKIATLSGTFQGTAVDPISGMRLRFRGALLQNQDAGRGFFLGANQSGGVLVNPVR